MPGKQTIAGERATLARPRSTGAAMKSATAVATFDPSATTVFRIALHLLK